MQSIKWLAVLAAVLIIVSCFFKWVSIEEKQFFIGGFFSSSGNRFGQPGILHLVFCSAYIVFIILNKVWSLRMAFFIAAFNIAWAIRNFVMISACSGGECPEKHTGLYVTLVASILLIILTPLIKTSPKISSQANS